MATLVCSMCKQKKDFRLHFVTDNKIHKTCHACRRRSGESFKTLEDNRKARIKSYRKHAPRVRIERRAADRALRRLKWKHPIEYGMYYAEELERILSAQD